MHGRLRVEVKMLRWKLPVLIALGVAAGCQTVPHAAAPHAISDDLRGTLAAMARAHEQKTMLAFYEALPWQRTAEPFHAFYATMGTTQGELLKDLQAWAGKNQVELKFAYTDDIAGRALKVMEARQEKLVRGDAKPDFTRDTLMQMYQDYEWHISQIQVMLPTVTDPELRAYLEKSLKVHEAGSNQLLDLLKKFKA
jgi:hypothetical protein